MRSTQSTSLKTAQTCGDLSGKPSAHWYSHRRFQPPRELGDWIEHFWIERWRVGENRVEKRELLPHPCVHLAIAPGQSRIFGVQLGRYTRTYTNDGRIFGVRFRPGAFSPFFGKPVASISNTSIAAVRVFPTLARAEAQILASSDELKMVAIISEFLMAHLPAPNSEIELVRELVSIIVSDRELTRVGQILPRFRGGERTLQRLFKRHVGASPRWVIKRYRTYEAIDCLSESGSRPLTDLAQRLGYFDQAHFINDFKKRVGRTPSRFQE